MKASNMEADDSQQPKRGANQAQSQSGKNGMGIKGDTQLKGSTGNQNQNQKQKQKQQQQQQQQDGIPIIPQKDLFQRINFSYQAAIFLQSLGSGQGQAPASSSRIQLGSGSDSGHFASSYSSDVQTKIDRKGKRKAIESDTAFPPSYGGVIDQNRDGVNIGTKRKFRQLARMNMREVNHMSVHNQLKLDPSLKRSLCKTCSTVLIPGLTSRIRNRPNRNSFSITHHTCLTCNSALSIPAPPIPIPIPPTPSSAGTSSEFETKYEVDREGLDGKNRKIRRKKASKRGKKIFHEVEKAPGDESGHTLWKGEEKLEGWGVKIHEREM